ncbi:MAG: recombinase family protein [Chthoniobacterales bacterium]
MALIGYARVSTDDQKLDLQVDALLKAGCDPDFIFKEHASGAKTQRPQLGLMMKTLRKGDVVVVYKLDRLGRSTTHLYQMMDHFAKHDIEFKSLTESIDTTTPMGKMVFAIFAAMAQLERDLISERTIAGLKAARARGRKGGRKPKLDLNKAKQAVQLLEDNPALTHEQVARMLGVSRATLYRAWERHNIIVDIQS